MFFVFTWSSDLVGGRFLNHSHLLSVPAAQSRSSASEEVKGRPSLQLMLPHRLANGQMQPYAGRFLPLFIRVKDRHTVNPPQPLTLVFVGEAPLSDGVAGGEALPGDGVVGGDGHGQDPGVGGHAARRRLTAVATDVGAH